MRGFDTSEYCLSSGTFAKLCGATRDALRYYHSQGILVPQQDEASGYYYYSYAQLASYYFITTFRNLGCSAADIREYLLGGEQARFDEFAARQYAALLAQRAALDRKILRLGTSLSLLENLRAAQDGVPAIQLLPEDLRLQTTPVHSSPALSFAQIAADVQRHLQGFPSPDAAFPMGAVIRVQDMLAGIYTYRAVFSFAAPHTPQSVCSPLPGRRAAAVVCRGGDADIAPVYAALARFITEEGLAPCSDVYSLSLVNVIDPNAARRYLKYIFICVDAPREAEKG